MSIHQRAAFMLGLAMILLGTTLTTTAQAACQGGVTIVEKDFTSGEVIQRIQCPSNNSKPAKDAAESRTCNRPSGDSIPCSTDNGVWSADRSCYTQRSAPGTVTADSPLGDQEGIAMRCTTLDGGSYLYLAPPGNPAPPDPRQLAQTAISRMDLHAIRIGSFPYTVEKSPMSLGVVGWNVWMWVDGASATTYGPVTKSASAGGYTVTATAQVAEVVWDMGNGDTVTCGKGTPYPATVDRDPVSPDCGYRYARDGRYTVTATTYWNITWAGIGQSGVIPMELTTTGELAIAEIQVLNIPVEQK